MVQKKTHKHKSRQEVGGIGKEALQTGECRGDGQVSCPGERAIRGAVLTDGKLQVVSPGGQQELFAVARHSRGEGWRSEL